MRAPRAHRRGVRRRRAIVRAYARTIVSPRSHEQQRQAPQSLPLHPSTRKQHARYARAALLLLEHPSARRRADGGLARAACAHSPLPARAAWVLQDPCCCSRSGDADQVARVDARNLRARDRVRAMCAHRAHIDPLARGRYLLLAAVVAQVRRTRSETMCAQRAHIARARPRPRDPRAYTCADHLASFSRAVWVAAGAVTHTTQLASGYMLPARHRRAGSWRHECTQARGAPRAWAPHCRYPWRDSRQADDVRRQRGQRLVCWPG